MKKEVERVFFGFGLDENNTLKKPIYAGDLTIDKTNGMELFFCINELPLYDKFNDKNICIYGQTISGKKFTINNYIMGLAGGQKLIQGGLLLSCYTITINRIFMGDWIPDIDNLKIDNILVRFSYFEHWLKPMEVKCIEKEKIDKYIIQVKQFKSDFNAIINEKLNIEIPYYFQTKTKGNIVFAFNLERFLKLNFPQTIEINGALDKVFILQSLFQVLIFNKKVCVENLNFYRNEQKIVIHETQSNYIPEKDNVSLVDFLDIFHEKKSEGLFIKWFNLYEKYGRIFYIIIANITRQPNSYIENSFLSKIQWMEGFCHIKYPTTTTKTEKSEHRIKPIKIKKNIKGDIKKNLKGDDLEYFKKNDGYPHKTNLITQLKRILEDYNILDIVGGDKSKLDGFIEDVKSERNNLTHGKNKEYNTTKLVYQDMFLMYLINIILIQELELSTNSHVYDEHAKRIKFYYNKYHTEND